MLESYTEITHNGGIYIQAFIFNIQTCLKLKLFGQLKMYINIYPIYI